MKFNLSGPPTGFVKNRRRPVASTVTHSSLNQRIREGLSSLPTANRVSVQPLHRPRGRQQMAVMVTGAIAEISTPTAQTNKISNE
jgi:hypothetical protein